MGGRRPSCFLPPSLQDQDSAAVTVSFQHLGPGGRGGRQAVKVVIEQALSLGLRLLREPPLDRISRCMGAGGRLSRFGSDARVGRSDGVRNTQSEAGAQQAALDAAQARPQEAEYAASYRSPKPTPMVAQGFAEDRAGEQPLALQIGGRTGTRRPNLHVGDATTQEAVSNVLHLGACRITQAVVSLVVGP